MPAGPAGPAGPVVPVSPLSPLSPLGPSKQPASVNAATHPTSAIATRIICPPPTQSSRAENLFNQLIGALLKRLPTLTSASMCHLSHRAKRYFFPWSLV